MLGLISLSRWIANWPVESQARARRNALVACTALAEVRREQHEVERFLEVHARRWAISHPA